MGRERSYLTMDQGRKFHPTDNISLFLSSMETLSKCIPINEWYVFLLYVIFPGISNIVRWLLGDCSRMSARNVNRTSVSERALRHIMYIYFFFLKNQFFRWLVYNSVDFWFALLLRLQTFGREKSQMTRKCYRFCVFYSASSHSFLITSRSRSSWHCCS